MIAIVSNEIVEKIHGCFSRNTLMEYFELEKIKKIMKIIFHAI